MQHKYLKFGHGFNVVLGDNRSQAAQMTLKPGQSEGGANTCHRGSDQWLYVVSGTGEAMVNGASIDLRSGALLLILRGELHDIRNSGTPPLHTLNLYVPSTTNKQQLERSS